MEVASTWAESYALKMSAIFRHMAQEAVKNRKWVPKELLLLSDLPRGIHFSHV